MKLNRVPYVLKISRPRSFCRIACGAAIVAVACLTVAASARATIVSFATDVEFSNGTAPIGTPPWLTVELNDHGGTGSVDLKLAAVNLTGSENVKDWYLNLNPNLNPNSLVFSAPTKSRPGFTTPTISTGVDAFKADGDGYFDISFGFAVGAGSDTFKNGDSIQYTISGIASLAATSFQFFSSEGGGQGTYVTAAHVQNTGVGGGGSGWVGDGSGGKVIIPEPASALLLGLGAVALLACALRRRK